MNLRQHCITAHLTKALYHYSANGGETENNITDNKGQLTQSINSNKADRSSTKDSTETGLNNNMTEIKSQNVGSLHIQKSERQNGTNIENDLIIEEVIIVKEKEQDDQDSAVCDVEDYVFGEGDEVVDARSDFCTDRHSPHTPHPNEGNGGFYFDHTSSANSSDQNENQSVSPVRSIPSECSVISLNSLPKPESVSGFDELVIISHDATEETKLPVRRGSDRSLSSFFTLDSIASHATHTSQDRLKLETLNSQLDEGDTYSLLSESEYSFAAESLASRSRIDTLEMRHLESFRKMSTTSSSASNGGSYHEQHDDWRRTLWDKSSEPDVFLAVHYR